MIEVNNIIKVFGNSQKIEKMLKEIKSEESLFDFNRIIPISRDENDIDMDDYMCACLNLFIIKNKVDRSVFYKTLKFVGHTRQVPYDFKEMTLEQINQKFASCNEEKMLSNAEYFLSKVRSKHIFNTFAVRNALWNVGSGATNITIELDNKKGKEKAKATIKFNTYYKEPLKIVQRLALTHPDLEFSYYYEKGDRKNLVLIRKNKTEYKVEMKLEDVLEHKLIAENVLI